MYKESPHLLKSRIKDLELQISKLRELIPMESTLEEFLNNVETDNGTDAVSVIDTDFKLIEVNDKRLERTDLQRKNLIGEKCYSVFYGLSKPCEECTVTRVINKKQPDRFLKSYKESDRVRFEEKYVSPILNDSGEIERLVIQSKDLSSYHHLIDRAGQREEIYQRIFESAGDAFLVHDENGKLIDFSSRLSEMLGYSENELKNLNVVDIDDPSNSLEFKTRQKNIQDHGSAVFETALICKSGQRIPVEVSANLTQISSRNIFFVAIRNVEKRKIAEEKLRESEERFRTLVENAPDLIMRFDRKHKHLFVNSAARSVLKIEPSEFIGKTHHEMGFPVEKCEFWKKEMDWVFRTQKPHSVEFSLHINEELHYFEWQLIPEFDSEGKNTTLMAIARDITSRKLSEFALNDAIKTKDKFFSIIAHDLKNPFNALLPITKSLEQNCKCMSADQIAEIASIINSSVKQEYNLLENLLEWSRSQMGKIKCSPREIDLLKLVEANQVLHEAKANKKNISVSIIADDHTTAFADKYMVDTIIRNLYSNALKFSYPGGEIKIKIQNIDDDIRLLIEDKGIGISPENQKKLFRIDTNYTRIGTSEESGTGLGLVLCKEFIVQNKGSISVQSEIGKGSIFSITLPGKSTK